MNLPNTNNITLTIMNLLNANSLTLIIATLIYGISVIALTTAISKKAKTEKQFWSWHTPAAITLAIAYVALTTAVLPEKSVVDLAGTPLCIAAAFIVTHISLPIFSDDVLNINPKHLRVWGEPALITVLGAGIGGNICEIVYNTLDLNETNFRHYGHSLRDVESGEGWWTYEEYSQSVKAYIKDAEGELKRVVDTYNEIAKGAEELLARALNPKKRTWA